MKSIDRLKLYYKKRKVENKIVNNHVKKMFYGEIDTLTWFEEDKRLNKELSELKNQKQSGV